MLDSDRCIVPFPVAQVCLYMTSVRDCTRPRGATRDGPSVQVNWAPARGANLSGSAEFERKYKIKNENMF